MAPELKKELAELEKRLWTPPNTKGITDFGDAFGMIGQATGRLTSSWDRPSGADETFVKRAERYVGDVLLDHDLLFRKDIAEFRRFAAEAQIKPSTSESLARAQRRVGARRQRRSLLARPRLRRHLRHRATTRAKPRSSSAASWWCGETSRGRRLPCQSRDSLQETPPHQGLQ